MDIEDQVELWDEGGIHVWATRRISGDLTFEGQDLTVAARGSSEPGSGEYEWGLTVQELDVPRLVTALGGSPRDDPLALIAASPDARTPFGQLTWLSSLGIEPTIWSRWE